MSDIRFLMLLIFLISENVLASSFHNYTIAIDPGHGGRDPGAVGFNGSAYPNEADIVLDIANRLKNSLISSHASVVMTRTSPESRTDNGKGSGHMELQARVKYINSIKPDAFISIHMNSTSGNGGGGTETYYHTNGTSKDAELADIIQEKIVNVVKKDDRRVKSKDLTILGVKSSIPAVLSEVVFINRKDEFEYIQEDLNKEKVANAYYTALSEFLDAPSHDLRMYSKLNIEAGGIKSGNPATVTVDIANYEKNTDFNGNIALALHTSLGEFLGDIEIHKNIMLDKWTYRLFTFYKSTIKSPPGNYQLHLKVQSNNGSWRLINSDGKGTNPKNFSIREGDSFVNTDSQKEYMEKCYSKYKSYFKKKIGGYFNCGNGYMCQQATGHWEYLSVYQDGKKWYVYIGNEWFGEYDTAICDK